MDLQDIERERAERKEALAVERNKQLLDDMKRLNEIEIERGDNNVTAVHVERYSPGVATLGIVRGLRKAELKRFRDRVRGEKADNAAAAEEAAMSALLYPEKGSDLWKATVEAAPGFVVRLGVAAVHLAAGLEQAEGK